MARDTSQPLLGLHSSWFPIRPRIHRRRQSSVHSCRLGWHWAPSWAFPIYRLLSHPTTTPAAVSTHSWSSDFPSNPTEPASKWPPLHPVRWQRSNGLFRHQLVLKLVSLFEYRLFSNRWGFQRPMSAVWHCDMFARHLSTNSWCIPLHSLRLDQNIRAHTRSRCCPPHWACTGTHPSRNPWSQDFPFRRTHTVCNRLRSSPEHIPRSSCPGNPPSSYSFLHPTGNHPWNEQDYRSRANRDRWAVHPAPCKIPSRKTRTQCQPCYSSSSGKCPCPGRDHRCSSRRDHSIGISRTLRPFDRGDPGKADSTVRTEHHRYCAGRCTASEGHLATRGSDWRAHYNPAGHSPSTGTASRSCASPATESPAASPDCCPDWPWSACPAGESLCTESLWTSLAPDFDPWLQGDSSAAKHARRRSPKDPASKTEWSKWFLYRSGRRICHFARINSIVAGNRHRSIRSTAMAQS